MLRYIDCAAIILIIILMYLLFSSDEVSRVEVCNTLDGRCYSVVEDFDSYKDASYKLAEANKFNIKLIKHLRRKYLWNNHPNHVARGIVINILQNYNPDGIIENAPKGVVNTSYVDNKGEEFGICLREKITGNNDFQDWHDLEFVLMHELAHMGNSLIGHGPEFWMVFRFILKEARSINLHIPKDYSKDPMNYCGLVVRDSPYYDNSVPDIV